MKSSLPKIPFVSKKTQFGIAMLEVLGSVGIGAAVLVGVADQTNRYLDNTKAANAGEYHRIASEAAAKFISDSTTDISNSPTKFDWNKVKQKVPEAKALADRNVFQEPLCLVGKKINGRKVAVLIAANSQSGGETDQAKMNVRRSIMVSGNNVATGRVAGNKASRGNVWEMDLSSWNLNGLCGPVEGAVITNLELMLAYRKDDHLLHRGEVPGRSDLNQMTTHLNLGGNNINEANDVTAGGTVRADGGFKIGDESVIDAERRANFKAGDAASTKSGTQFPSRENGRNYIRGTTIIADTGGNLGVGTNTPAHKLHVAGNTGIDGNLYFGKNNRQMLNLWDKGHGIGVQDYTTYFRSNYDFQFYRGGQHSNYGGDAGGGTTILTLKESGNVGIGTQTPTTKLQVDGADWGGFRLRGRAPTMVFSDTEGGVSPVLHANTNRLYFLAGGQDALTYDTATYGWPMTILFEPGGGKVGIGHHDPTTKLMVSGLASVLHNGTPTTVANANQLQIGEASNNSAYRLNIGYSNIGGVNGWSGVLQALNNNSGAPILINPNGGNVGIGTNNPKYPLHVDGDIYAKWYRSAGNTGWYSEKWGGGWHMTDATWLRSYNDKNIYTGGLIRADSGFDVGGVTVIDDNRNLININNISLAGNIKWTKHGTNYIGNGSGDDAKLGKYNLAIRSWWGIGFPSYDNVNRIVLDTRSGSAHMLGTMRADTGFNVNGQIVIDSDRHLKNIASGNIQNNLVVNSSNSSGGGIILSDDGDIVDLNDGYASMRFSNGVRVFNRKSGGSAVITLGSDGTVSTQNVSSQNGYLVGAQWVIDSMRDAFLRVVNAVQMVMGSNNGAGNQIAMQDTGDNRITGLTRLVGKGGAEINVGGSTVNINKPVSISGNVTSTGTVAGNNLKANQTVAFNAVCSDKGAIARTNDGYHVFCNGSQWKPYSSLKVIRVDTTHTEYLDGNSTVGRARCPAGSILISGGGNCTADGSASSGENHYMHSSKPGLKDDNEWIVDCFDKHDRGSAGFVGDKNAQAYALCLQVSGSIESQTEFK